MAGDDLATADTGGASRRAPGSVGTSVERFEELYRRCRLDLVTYAERRGARDPELVADLALLDVHRALDRLRSDHPRVIWAYLYRATDNHLRRESSAFSPELRADVDDLGGSCTFEDDVVGHLSLDDTLALLSPDQEAVLRPKLEENLTAEEIGVRVGKTANAVRQLQHRAIGRLRSILFVAVTAIIVLLTIALGGRQTTVDQSPATSVTELPASTTVPQTSTSTSPGERSAASSGLSAQGGPPADAPTGATVDPTDGTATTTSPVPVGDGLAPAPTDAPTTSDPTATTVTSLPGQPAVPPAPGGSFALANLGSDQVEYCIDQPWSQEDRAEVYLWRCAGHTASNQVFSTTGNAQAFSLVFAHSGKCLDQVDDRFIQFGCHGGDNQLFTWVGAQLRGVGSGQCLTVVDEPDVQQSGLAAAPCVDSPAQRFRMERYGTQLAAG